MRRTSYKGRLQVTFNYQINGETVDIIDESVGEIPIMLKSKRCNLRDLNPVDYVTRFEDAEEIGGYFIINGNERVIRLLTAQRRHYVSWAT